MNHSQESECLNVDDALRDVYIDPDLVEWEIPLDYESFMWCREWCTNLWFRHTHEGGYLVFGALLITIYLFYLYYKKRWEDMLIGLMLISLLLFGYFAWLWWEYLK